MLRTTPARSPGALFLLVVLGLGAAGCGGGDSPDEGRSAEEVQAQVDAVIRPLMEAHSIPGMSVSVHARGESHHFHFGAASLEEGRPVTPETLFELGSVSKLYTATLGALAEAQGRLSFSDPVSRFAPELAESPLGAVPLLDLLLYTAGGLPLQFPSEVVDSPSMFTYYRGWEPAHPAGTHRLYSNPSIGLFGFLVARSFGAPFIRVMEDDLLSGLGLERTHVDVPPDRLDHYAWGYSSSDEPIRVNPGVLDAEAYGLKATSADVLRFVEANLYPAGLQPPVGQAIRTTQVGFDRVGPLIQGPGWESYPFPTELDRLLQGSGASIVLEANPVERFDPPWESDGDRFFHKTGSTNGFGAYVAFVPGEEIGIVLLANRNYPNAARITAAHEILSYLAGSTRPAPLPPERAGGRAPGR